MHIIHITIFVVIDTVSGDLSGIYPDIIFKIFMIYVNAWVNNSNNNAFRSFIFKNSA